jgi:hypothetical protein
MGGITFLITTLYPPLPVPLIISIYRILQWLGIPDWMHALWAYNVSGGIAWHLLKYARENAFADYPLGALLMMILPFCTVPIAFTLSSILKWRRVVNRAPYPMPQHGLLAVIQAAALSLLAVVLLSLLYFGIAALFFPSGGTAQLALLVFCLPALAQTLWVLPSLLIIGGNLATMQARSLTD